jgi:hypothetical protein
MGETISDKVETIYIMFHVLVPSNLIQIHSLYLNTSTNTMTGAQSSAASGLLKAGSFARCAGTCCVAGRRDRVPSATVVRPRFLLSQAWRHPSAARTAGLNTEQAQQLRAELRARVLSEEQNWAGKRHNAATQKT